MKFSGNARCRRAAKRRIAREGISAQRCVEILKGKDRKTTAQHRLLQWLSEAQEDAVFNAVYAGAARHRLAVAEKAHSAAVRDRARREKEKR